MLPRLLMALAVGATLSGCGEPAQQGQADAIRVVAGRAGPAASLARASMPAPAARTLPAAQATPVRQLSVAESATINTPEMWSEPIK